MAFSPDGRYVATALGQVREDLGCGEREGAGPRFSGHKKIVFGVAFHPGGQWVALSSDRHATRMGEVKVWDSKTGEELPLTIHDPAEMFR